MSDYDNSGIKRKPSPISVTTAWLILAIVVLVTIVLILGYSFLTGTMFLKDKELTIWSMLIAAAISCVFGAITSYLSQKSEENKETNIVQEIKNFLTKKTDEITSVVTLRHTDFVSGEQKDILDKLMNRCSETGEKGEKIERIRILAQESSSFSEFFTTHFKDTPFICHDLEILIHNPDININNPIIGEWMRLFNAKKNKIRTMCIKKTHEIKRMVFFGIIIKFQQGHHSIGMMGFYEPQEDNGGSRLNPFNKRYGILSEENSILNVFDEYFNRYFDRAEILKDECNNHPD